MFYLRFDVFYSINTRVKDIIGNIHLRGCRYKDLENLSRENTNGTPRGRYLLYGASRSADLTVPVLDNTI